MMNINYIDYALNKLTTKKAKIDYLKGLKIQSLRQRHLFTIESTTKIERLLKELQDDQN